MSQEVLVLFAYHFPPENAIGGVRPARFQKYLQRRGVRCHVITAADVSSRPDLDAEYVPDPFESTPREGLGWQVERGLRKFILPGVTGTQWAFAAYKKAKQFIDSQANAQVTILSTYPPLGPHLAGYWLARKTRLPWIADFRDPLANAPGIDDFSRFHHAAHAKLERALIRKADCVIANTDTAQDQLKLAYPGRANRIQLLWNGFDPEQRLAALPVADPTKMVISHVGELYAGRNVTPLLTSLARLIAANRLCPHAFQILLVGPAKRSTLPDDASVSRATEEGWLKLAPEQIAQDEALQITRSSGGLLLVQPQSNVQVPGKLYDYIQIGRPILAFILPDSPIERILERSRIAYQCVYPSDSPAKFDESVLRFFQLDTTPKQPSAWFEDTFNTQKHAERLHELMRELHATA